MSTGVCSKKRLLQMKEKWKGFRSPCDYKGSETNAILGYYIEMGPEDSSSMVAVSQSVWKQTWRFVGRPSGNQKM